MPGVEVAKGVNPVGGRAGKEDMGPGVEVEGMVTVGPDVPEAAAVGAGDVDAGPGVVPAGVPFADIFDGL